MLPISVRSIVTGLAAAAALLGLYLAIIGLAQGVEHAFEQVAADALLIALIAAGFGFCKSLMMAIRIADTSTSGG